MENIFGIRVEKYF